ncbi:MAG: NAD(P)H-dependent oxidoreductase [Desulfobacterales bacterium]
MKILALNSSPRTGDRSKTELMLNHLVEGMRDAGAEVEVVNLRQKTVKNCIGCYACWTKTPGKCIHKDDMSKELLPKWLKAELVVYATPLYNFTMNAAMKAFIERCLPALEPFFEKRGDRTAHPWRQDPPQAVVLSVAGFPEMSVFDQLSNYVKFLLGGSDGLWAEIYRPAAESLSMMGDKNQDVFKATVEAGRELVKSRRISVETLARIQKPIIDFPAFARIGNLFWKTCIEEGVTPKEFQDKKMVPRPNSIEDFMVLFPLGLNIEAAGKKKVILQFKFSGDLDDSCYFVIEKDNVDAKEGSRENPNITIETPFELWMDIITGKADGQQMFMEQKYKVDGDLPLMTQLFHWESHPA